MFKNIVTQSFKPLWGIEHSPKAGFTLAEVLITLGIIGVVAAMTIPTLVADYQEKSWSTASSVFERKLEEALKVMNTQQTLAGYTTTEAFVDELKKHIKIIKTCDNDKLDSCFPKTFTYGFPETETMDITTFTDSSKLRKEPFGTNTVGVQFANGVSGVLAYDPNCKQDPYSNQVTGMGCISMIYDTSGSKSPNTSNKDLRLLNVNKLYGFKINGTKYTAPYIADPVTKAECEQMLADGYNVVGCKHDNDYWAGAVKACGGTDKMPNQQQLADIALIGYGDTSTCPEYTDCRDFKKLSSLGFNFRQDATFGIWANTTLNEDGAFEQLLNPRQTNYGVSSRYQDYFTVCLDN